MTSTAITENDLSTGLEYVRYEKLNQKLAGPFKSLIKCESGIAACFFFAMVNKVGAGIMQQKRVILIGSSALYQCSPDAEVNRCVPIQDILELIVGPDNWIGIRVPAQYDIMFQCLTNADTRHLQRCLVCLYRHQSGGVQELTIRHSVLKDFKSILHLNKPEKWVGVVVTPFSTVSLDELARRRLNSAAAPPLDGRTKFLEEKILDLEERMLEEHDLMEKLDEAATQYQQQCDVYEVQRGVLLEELADLKQKLENQEQITAAVRNERDSYAKDRLAFERTIAELNSETRLLRDNIERLSSEVVAVRAENQLFEENLRTEKDFTTNLLKEMDSIHSQLRAKESHISKQTALEAEWTSIRLNLEAKIARLEPYDGIDLKEIGETAAAMMAENESLRDEISTLEAALRNSEQRSFESLAERKEYHSFRESVEEREHSLHLREVKAATALRDAEGTLRQKDMQLQAAEDRINSLVQERELSSVLRRRLADSEQKSRDIETLLQVSTKVWNETQVHYQAIISRQAMECETLNLKLKDMERRDV